MDNPLVSIVVITYNSSKYILECLDSIYNQTYENIELVISDDASQDNTVNICQSWLETYSSRFFRTKLVTTQKNTGVPANCNRGVCECHGEWIKIIAGDDMLLPNCMLDFSLFAKPEMELIVVRFQTFSLSDGILNKKTVLPLDKLLFFFQMPQKKQLKYVLTKQLMITPGLFVRNSVYRRLGLYDERYPMFEDVPFYVKLSENGIRFYLLNKICVLYRVNHKSISHTNEKCFNVNYRQCSFRYHDEVLKKKIPWWNIIAHESAFMDRLNFKLILRLANNRRNKCSFIINCITYRLRFDTYYNKLYVRYCNNKYV